MPKISDLTADSSPVAGALIPAVESGGTVIYTLKQIADLYGVVLETRDPTMSDKDYQAGMRWVNTSSKAMFQLYDASTGDWRGQASNPAGVTKSQVGLGNVPNLKHNLTATTDPTVNDDSGDGYAVGSIWVNTGSGGSAFLCQSAASGAADWIDLTSASIAAQPTLTGPRTAYSDISNDFTAGAQTLSTNYTDFVVDDLSEDVTITVPDPPTGVVWQPTIEIRQDATGGRAVTFKDASGTTIDPMSSSLDLATDADAVTLVTFWYSHTANRWLLIILNTWTGTGSVGDSNLHEYDESGQALGGAASGITNVWRNDTWTIEEDNTYAVGDIRRVFINEQPAADDLHAGKIDAGGDNITDVEILALVRTGSNTNSYKNTIYARGAGTEALGGKASYGLALLAGTTLRVIKTSGNTITEIASAAFAWSKDTEYWLRFSVTGTALKGKAWKYGDSEPGSWSIDTTDSGLASGWVGIGSYQDAGPHRTCYFAWRTDGNALPVPS